jgi:ornithine carbamoyltransferase
MTTLTTPRHVLRVADLSAEELERLLDLAARMKADPGGWTGALPGRALASLFEKPSTRTRASLAVAAHRLGMLPLALRPDELQLGRGETIADTARVLSGYAAAITVRTFAQATLEELASHATVPVINALSDDHHPCQALADLFTVRERFGTLHGLKLAYVGDGNNVAHSLLEAGALSGLNVVVATPLATSPTARCSTAPSICRPTMAACSRPRTTRVTRWPVPMPCTPTYGCRWAMTPSATSGSRHSSHTASLPS